MTAMPPPASPAHALVSERLDHLPDALSDFAPFAPAADRAAWDGLPAETRRRLLARGDACLGQPVPALAATAYMDFIRTGDRARFEAIYFARRRALNALVLAECVEHSGRFFDSIIDYATAIAEESAWQLPAHNSYIRDTPRVILPDVTRPVIDLFAAETGAQLAVLRFLLKAELDAISPLIAERIRHELEIRIVEPYRTQHFWWMGNGDEPMNNWTAWCTQNVLITVFTSVSDQTLRRQVVAKAAGSLDAFLKDYGEDGCCEEGVLYYRHAGLCLFNALDVLDRVSGGAFAALWRTPKIRRIADYILTMHVADQTYFNFADCSAVIDRCGAREFLFGQRVESPALAAFAAADWRREPEPDLPDEINLYYRLQAAFTAPALAACPPPAADPRPDVYFPSNGLFIARCKRFDLAVKAGDNGDSHNHNDTGSLTLYKNGQPLLIDVGVETYTAKTFSRDRYQIWTMQSAYHNLPSFGGVMQAAGAAFAAHDVAVGFGTDASTIHQDIAGTYPPEAGVSRYQRSVTLEKNRAVHVEDLHVGTLPAELSLMFAIEPSLENGAIVLPGFARLDLTGAGPMRVETIAITDARLRLAWPDQIFRVLVPFAGRLALTIT